MSSDWKEASVADPCKICEHTSWCRSNGDGSLTLCRRLSEHESFGRGREKKDKNGEPFYLFVTGPRPAKGSPPTHHHSEGTASRASPEELDVVYRALLRELARCRCLAFQQELDRRAVPGDSPLRKRLRWASLRGRSGIAAKLVADGLEPIMARTPGFYVKEGNGGSRYWTYGGSPGLWIPVRDGKGRIVAICIRPETPQRGKYSSLSSKKHGGAKACRAVHVPFDFAGDTSTVRVTEGALKASVATALDPTTLTLGMPGLYSRDLVKTLRQLNVKTVRLALDADARENPHVAKAIQTHYRRLKKSFEVELEVWNAEDGKGIDDLLAARKESMVLVGESVEAMVAALVPEPDESESEGRGGRLLVPLSENESDVVCAVIGGLARNHRLFCRDTALVEIGWTTDEIPSPKIVPLKVAAVRTRITESIDLRQGKKLDPASPPNWLAPAVHANNFFPGIRPLHAVATSPVLRADGTIHQKPGYDAATRILLFADADFAPIPENPGQEQALQACRLLLSGVQHFPFLTETDQVVWLAEVLTIVGRHAIAGPVPLFFHIANCPGSGKTALAKAACLIGTGHEIPSTAYPTIKGADHAEEIRKLITSCAIEGHLAFLIDNAPSGHACGCSALDAFATSTTNSDRQLGTNQAPRRPMYTVAVITGNNIRPTGDTVRRTLALRLEAHAERPDEVEYPGPEVTSWAKQERGTLFTAALTILSAYIRAGRPNQKLKPFGSFEEWSALVRSAIIWCGHPDPCGNRQSFVEDDDDRTKLKALFDLMHLTRGDEFMGVAEITRRVRDEIDHTRPAERKEWTIVEVPEGQPAIDRYRVIFPYAKRPDATKLGNLMRRLKGRTVDGRTLERGEDNSNQKVATWRVKVAGGENASTRMTPRKCTNPPQSSEPGTAADSPEPSQEAKNASPNCGGCATCGGSENAPPAPPPATQVGTGLGLDAVAGTAGTEVDPLAHMGHGSGIQNPPNTASSSIWRPGGSLLYPQSPQHPQKGRGRMGWCGCGSRAMSEFCRVCRKCLDAEAAKV